MREEHDEQILHRTQQWLRSFIIELNVCPFAKQALEKNRIHYQVIRAIKNQIALEEFLLALIFLDNHPDIETTLLLFPSLFGQFHHYLDFVDYAERIIRENNYEGIYQLATFHPNYCFDGVESDDISNYTNRSPYTMLHILREESVDKAIGYYGDTEKIPEKNIALMRTLGLSKIEKILTSL